MLLFGRGLSERMGYGGYWNVYIYIGIILFSDCFTAILFAKLRQENRAWRFAAFKVVKILAEAGTNLLLFLWYPRYAAAHPDNLLSGLIPAVPDFPTRYSPYWSAACSASCSSSPNCCAWA